MAILPATWVTAFWLTLDFLPRMRTVPNALSRPPWKLLGSFPNCHLRGRHGLKYGLALPPDLVLVGDLIGEGSSREFGLIGDAPNLAASLQQLAKPNQILVAPSTRRLLGDLFEFEDLGDQDIKGFSAPIMVSRVRGHGTASRFEARQSSHIAPLIGREAELAVMHWGIRKSQSGKRATCRCFWGTRHRKVAARRQLLPSAHPGSVTCFRFSVRHITSAAPGIQSFAISMTYWAADTRPAERQSYKNLRH